MRKAYLAAALLAIPVAATAQPADPAQQISADWQAMMTSTNHVAQAISQILQENAALKAENQKLKDAAKTPENAPK